jgi:hypothetical protein
MSLRLKHMSRHTEASYIFYILGYLCSHGKRHPRQVGTQDIRTYLSHLSYLVHLATGGRVVASNPAHLLMIYTQVLSLGGRGVPGLLVTGVEGLLIHVVVPVWCHG